MRHADGPWMCIAAAMAMFAFTAAAGQSAGPPPTLAEVRFEGNERTRPQTLRREMLLGPGDPADPDLIEQSRQAIMDLELFRTVTAEVQDTPDGAVLVIRVEEKRYVFVLPIASRNPDGDITFGASATINNLWGLDHRLKIEAERTNAASDAAVDDEEVIDFEYSYPRVGGGPWQVDASGGVETAEVTEDAGAGPGVYARDLLRGETTGSRWLSSRGPSRGWRVGVGLTYDDYAFEPIEGDPTIFFDTTELGLLLRAELIDVRVYEFDREGRSFRYDVRAFSKDVVSSRDRLQHFVRYRHYTKLAWRRHTNLNWQVRAALATKPLFDVPTYGIAGSSDLRGYERDQIEGDAYVLVNVEFITPIARPNTLRGVVFVDAGDAFDELRDALPLDLKFGAGLGLRWKVRAFVRVDLRLDVAYGFDEESGGRTRVYAGSDVTF